MFYAYVVAGFVIFGTGLVLIPGWWKLAWIAACLALLAVLPALLAKMLDPLNARRIRRICAEAGATDVEVEPFPNHYGVHFMKNERKHYAKCTVARGEIKWKGVSPAEVP
jgi:hypothetical protein